MRSNLTSEQICTSNAQGLKETKPEYTNTEPCQKSCNQKKHHFAMTYKRKTAK